MPHTVYDNYGSKYLALNWQDVGEMYFTHTYVHKPNYSQQFNHDPPFKKLIFNISRMLLFDVTIHQNTVIACFVVTSEYKQHWSYLHDLFLNIKKHCQWTKNHRYQVLGSFSHEWPFGENNQLGFFR